VPPQQAQLMAATPPSDAGVRKLYCSIAREPRRQDEIEDAEVSKSVATASTADGGGDSAQGCGSKGTPLQHREGTQASVVTAGKTPR
jgi:hypothetical protein